MVVRLTVLAAAVLAGCASPPPPERVERDAAILAAIQPCKERHAMDLYNTNLMSVQQNGVVRYWVRDTRLGASYEIDQCISEAVKGLRLGPWSAARVTQRGPASVDVKITDKGVLAPVRLNGTVGMLFLAPKSQLTYVTPAFAKRAGLQIVSESPTTFVRSGAESSVEIPFVRSRTLEIGAVSVETLDVGIYEDPRVGTADGVLGGNVLSQFRTNLDRRNNRLLLEPASVSLLRGL